MAIAAHSIRQQRAKLASTTDPTSAIYASVEHALAHANGNASHNTYLWSNEAWTRQEAERSAATFNIDAAVAPTLCGILISVKDCFDLAGSPTSCGTKFYRDLNGIAPQNSWLVDHLRAAGAIIVGKTHLHPLAYGITGENPEFGDCIQPGNPSALTGGSSSGAAASVMEGSAMAAIGTDTGGSVRVPAALCGLSGYRASLGRGTWRGGAHLAQSFDTLGWLFRDLEDGPLLGSLFGPVEPSSTRLPATFAVISDDFLHDCEPAVVDSLNQCRHELVALGLTASTIDIDWWSDSREIFAPIQASEAARIHAGHYAHFELSIRERLEWGASLDDDTIVQLRRRHAAFRDRMDALLTQHRLLLMPASPVVQLTAGADHSQTRARLLRYTAPVSLAGMPAVTIPFLAGGKPKGGMQLVAAREEDAMLLAIAARLGAQRKSLV
jgi:Asp-tRNA(Asn)/Glu-tRNA(Gln) amidotransferase A subunit family amidase